MCCSEISHHYTSLLNRPLGEQNMEAEPPAMKEMPRQNSDCDELCARPYGTFEANEVDGWASGGQAQPHSAEPSRCPHGPKSYP